MRHSVTWKLILAFWGVSLTVALLGAWIVRWFTMREFNQFVLEQAQNRFIADVTFYYRMNGSWQGVWEFIRQRNIPVPPPANAPQAQPPLLVPQSPSVPGNKALIFLLADEWGRVVVPAAGYHLGEILPDEALDRATPLEVDGRVVGYVLFSGDPPELDVREQQYLARTNRALALATLGAMLIALILGFLLARALTRPLRELTRALRAMSSGKLAQSVPVRTRDELGELTMAFNQMSAELAQADQARRRLTADIAHDLRTPLTVIAGYLEAMQEGVLAPTNERLQAIQTEVSHLQRLVEDLRMLSLADAGELHLSPQQIAPQDLLQRLSNAFAAQAQAQGIRLETQVQAEMPLIEVDVERMVQVLGNLISNSLRHTPAGGHIWLKAEAQNGLTQLIVEDTGEGIPAEALPHIFDRFYRVESSRQGGRGESGLGLAIVKSIVTAHGGSIHVYSQLGEGTRFTISLPQKGK